MKPEQFSDVQNVGLRSELPPSIVVDAWSSSPDAKSWTRAQVGARDDAGEDLNFSVDDLYASSLKPIADLAQNESRAVGLPDEPAQPDDGNVSADTLAKLQDVYRGLGAGDIQVLQSYIKNMNDATDPDLAKDLKRGLDGFFEFLGMHGITARTSPMQGGYTIEFPSDNGVAQSLTISQNGDTDLKDADLSAFQKGLSDYVLPKIEEPDYLSDLMTNRLNGIEDGIAKNDLSGLTDTMGDIADRIHSAAPGDDGAVDRQIAADLQRVLDVLAADLSNDRVRSWYDRGSGSFTIGQANARGGTDMLTVDKFGGLSLSGHKLHDFLTQLHKNLSQEPEPQQVVA